MRHQPQGDRPYHYQRGRNQNQYPPQQYMGQEHRPSQQYYQNRQKGPRPNENYRN